MEEWVQERVWTTTAELERKVGQMFGQLSAQNRWIAQLSEMMGVPPSLTTPARGEAERETDDTFIPPPDFHPDIPPHSPSPPPLPSA
jgi:hypothetical protein